MNLWLGLLLYVLVGVGLNIITIVITVIYVACRASKGDAKPAECLEECSGIWTHPEMRGDLPVWFLIVRMIVAWPIQLPTGISALVDMLK